MKKDLQEHINRIKELSGIEEEMEVSQEFSEDPSIDETNKRVILKIGEDSDDLDNHESYLMMKFTTTEDFRELIYYFQMFNSDGKVVGSTFLRSEAKKYIPKELQGQRLILPKINELFNKLITMEKPIRFLMETHEDLSDDELKRFEPLVETIMEQGYNIKRQGRRPDNKYFWRFSTESQEILDEQDHQDYLSLPERDWDKFFKEEAKLSEEWLNNKKKGLL